MLATQHKSNQHKKHEMYNASPSCWGPNATYIFHLLTLGVGVRGNANFSICVGGNANISVFRYQHVGIPNAKLWPWGKEGVLLRNVSPSLVLCDHFPGGGILELQTGSSSEWTFIVSLFWE